MDYANAIADFTKCIGYLPKYAAAYYNRGLAKNKAAQADNGCSDFAKALELGDPDAADAIQKLCK